MPLVSAIAAAPFRAARTIVMATQGGARFAGLPWAGMPARRWRAGYAARIEALLLVALSFAGALRAASPHLANIDPPGIQRGADTDVTISGDRLQDAQGLLFYSPGIDVLSLQAAQ